MIILSDYFPSQNGGGISLTLYNIFDYLIPSQVIYLHDGKEKIQENNLFSQNCISVKLNWFPFLKNRLGRYINPFVQFFNFSIRELCLPFHEKLPSKKESF